MKKLLIIISILFTVSVIGLVGASFFLKPYFEQAQLDARKAQIRATLMSVYTAVHAYQAEYSTFPITLEESGFTITSPYPIEYESDGYRFKAIIVYDGFAYGIDQDRKLTE